MVTDQQTFSGVSDLCTTRPDILRRKSLLGRPRPHILRRMSLEEATTPVQGLWTTHAPLRPGRHAALMGRVHAAPRELRGQPFIGSQAVAAGLVTRRRLLGPAFRRVLHGVYIDAGSRIDHGVRCRAAALLLPASTALSGLSAAWWYGIRLASNDDRVLAASPRIVHVDGPRGVMVHQTPLDLQDVMVVSGLTITSPARAAWDVATLEDCPKAVATIDAMLHSGVLRTSDLTNRLALSGGLWRVSRARHVLSLVDGRSESPPESRLRLTFIEAGLPPATPQYEVRKDDLFVARVDLAWPAARVAVEYDGAHHADPLQMRRDRRRLNALVDAGWLVIHATAGDLHAPHTLIKQVTAALRGRAA